MPPRRGRQLRDRQQVFKEVAGRERDHPVPLYRHELFKAIRRHRALSQSDRLPAEISSSPSLHPSSNKGDTPGPGLYQTFPYQFRDRPLYRGRTRAVPPHQIPNRQQAAPGLLIPNRLSQLFTYGTRCVIVVDEISQ